MQRGGGAKMQGGGAVSTPPHPPGKTAPEKSVQWKKKQRQHKYLNTQRVTLVAERPRGRQKVKTVMATSVCTWIKQMTFIIWHRAWQMHTHAHKHTLLLKGLRVPPLSWIRLHLIRVVECSESHLREINSASVDRLCVGTQRG